MPMAPCSARITRCSSAGSAANLPLRRRGYQTAHFQAGFNTVGRGRFAALPADEQRVILAEHGAIGMSFGAGDYAHDIRLACHGLDKDDNDFVVGLIGKDLYPLSAIVQSMRKTQQTSLYLERLGPFFVGRALWQATEGM